MIQLISRASTGKLKVLEFDYHFDESIQGYIIERFSYQYGGKITQQPSLQITSGKAGRNKQQQVELEFNHLIKHAKDRGYKQLELPIDNYTKDELESFVGSIVVSQDGIPKPMLAKQADSIANKKVFDKHYYASPKVDGLRCLIFLGNDNKLHTASRGAVNYDAAMHEILDNPTLIKIFKEYPNLIMDGEAYHHGFSLQQINSVARTQVVATDYEFLQFYWFDIVDVSKPFKNRIELLNYIANKYNLIFDPSHNFEQNELHFQIVPHIEITGYDNMINLHDKYVNEGWEGLVVRNADSVYKPGSRSNDMIKIKKYQDSEFKIIGYELGLRGIEDMVFQCITDDGKEFLAKPMGDINMKKWYVTEFENKCLNKMATIKYFYLSDDGIPLQPVMKSIRYDTD